MSYEARKQAMEFALMAARNRPEACTYIADAQKILDFLEPPERTAPDPELQRLLAEEEEVERRCVTLPAGEPPETLTWYRAVLDPYSAHSASCKWVASYDAAFAEGLQALYAKANGAVKAASFLVQEAMTANEWKRDAL